MKTFEYTIKDPLGIHARPAGMLVKAAKAFESEITVHHKEKVASGHKLLSLMGLGVKPGDKVQVEISGKDEDAAEKELKAFFETNL